MAKSPTLVTRWYTANMQSDWVPKSLDDFNPFFRQELAEVRQTYHLQSVKFGLDESDYLRPVIVRQNQAFACLKRLGWSNFTGYGQDTKLKFRITLSLCIAAGGWIGVPEYQEIYSLPIAIRFPARFPAKKPHYAIDRELMAPDDPRQKSMGWDQGGYICTLNGSSLWKEQFSLLDTIDVMVDWLGANYFGPDGLLRR